MKVLTFLQGKKTYILVACALVVAGLHVGGVLDTDSTNIALAALGMGSLATLRSAITTMLAQRGSVPPTAPPAA